MPRIGGMNWTAWVEKYIGDDGRADGTSLINEKKSHEEERRVYEA